MARIYHADLWGLRQQKYDWLDAHDLKHTEWTELEPQSPFYLFVPRDCALEAAYQRYPSVREVFPVNSVGIVTARDKLTIRWSAEEVWRTVTVFSRMDPELARQAYDLGKDVRDWKVTLAQKDILDSGPTREKIVPILYRPFDLRYTYYTGRSRGLIGQPQKRVMRHMLAGENVALSTTRNVEIGPRFHHVFCASRLIQHHSVSLKEVNYLFPLYLYPHTALGDMFAHHETSERRPNLNPNVVSALAEAYGREPSPEDVFHYVYAVLYAPAYRKKYAEFLRMDFPRIPFTADAELFAALAGLGGRLTDLHLLRSPELDPPLCRFEGRAENRVAKGTKAGVRYEEREGRVYINATQYFAPVPPAVWAYQVGGYQVCEKWLKDRRDRRLELNDIRTYCRIVTALRCTFDIQQEIEALYPQAEDRTVSFAETQ